MEPHFADNCRSLTEKLHALREPDDLCFALLAGTAVSDFADHTDENIRAVDAQTHFDGVIHLGDILNGCVPLCTLAGAGAVSECNSFRQALHCLRRRRWLSQ